MMNIQILHRLNKIGKENIRIGFDSKMWTHIFTTVDQTAPSMYRNVQKCVEMCMCRNENSPLQPQNKSNTKVTDNLKEKYYLKTSMFASNQTALFCK